jgi:cyclase
MLKKRLIFTLLYNNGQFMLSRNFRLQKVGDVAWLNKNYDFSKIAFSIDELVVLDVTRERRNPSQFCQTLEALAEHCFVPIAAGGGVADNALARALLRSGADKVVVNTALAETPVCIDALAVEFGQQCIVASVDVKGSGDHATVFVRSGSQVVEQSAKDYLAAIAKMPIGELYLCSIDRDGTGQGLDLALLDLLSPEQAQPVILAGGIGNLSHMTRGLEDPRLDAVATAHLFNFVGDGLIHAREGLNDGGIPLASWDLDILKGLK